MTSNPTGNVIQLMTRVLGSVFGTETWATWRAALKAAFALGLTDAERTIVTELTQRTTLPTAPVRELWMLLGRRSGKSIIAALLAVWATCCRAYTLAPGEVGIFVIVAADLKQARIIKRYIAGLLRAHPSLATLIDHETAEAIWLTNGLCIELHTCSWKTLRGYTCIGAAVDEVAFWDAEGSNPDKEVLVALRAAMASVPEAMLIGLTSVYARKGEPWRIFGKHYGRNESADVLVLNGPTRAMNPTIDAQVIAAAYEDDPAAAGAEYGAEFRKDVEALLSIELVQAAIVPGRDEVPPVLGVQYEMFFDGASGSSVGGDEAAHAIAHRTADGRIVVDVIEAVRPPFDPATVVSRFAATAQRYRVRTVTGDAWAGEWPRAAFEGLGVRYQVASKPKGELYRELLPLFSGHRVELPDSPVLTKQLLGLERRQTRSGREVIDHGNYRGAHDDRANVLAGVAFELRDRRPQGPSVGAIMPGAPVTAAARYQVARATAAEAQRLWKKHKLVSAPEWSAPSMALQETRAEMAAREAHTRGETEKHRAHVANLGQRDADAELRKLVDEFGPDVVEAIQHAPLPEHLKQRKG